jgi:hypothetical protein
MVHLLLQNNIMDLWSLFDFLMPGFLGTERQVCFVPGFHLVFSISCLLGFLFTQGPLCKDADHDDKKRLKTNALPCSLCSST